MKTKKGSILTTVIFCLLFASNSHAQFWQWSKAIVSDNYAQVSDFCFDNNGNIYCTGIFTGTTDFDPGNGVFNITTSYDDDAFYAKYSSSGDLIWIKTISGNATEGSMNILLDSVGNIYLSGYFSDSLIIDGDTSSYLLGSVCQNTFVIKCDYNGNPMWKKAFVVPVWIINSAAIPTAISLDNHLNVYLGGYYNAPTDFDPDTSSYYFNPSANGSLTGYFVKLNSNGELIWVKNYGGKYLSIENFIRDSKGNLIVYGELQGPVDLDNDSITPLTVDTGHFILKTDTSGNFISVKILRTSGTVMSAFGTKLALDKLDNIYITGELFGTTDFDPGVGTYYLTNVGGVADVDMFVCSLDSNGNFKWANRFGANDDDWGKSIAVDNKKNVYVTGYYGDTVDFDPGPGVSNLISHGYNDAFLLILDSMGNFKNAFGFGGQYSDMGYSVKLDNHENCFVSGWFSSTVDFDPSLASYYLTAGLTGAVFFSKFLGEANFITGRIYEDYNGNAILENGEPLRPNILAEINPGPLYFNSDPSGIYKAVVDTGAYTVTIPSPPLYRTVNPLNHNESFLSLNNIDSLNDFGLLPAPNVNDLRITITPYSNPTPITEHLMEITYTNIGTTIMSGYVKMVTDSNLFFKNSIPTESNIIGDSIFWNFTNLLPYESRNILVTDSLNIFFTNSFTNTSVVVYPLIGDTTVYDNSDNLHELITSSFDPNYKESFPAEVILPSQVSNGDYLTYTIHFQNTGNDTAFTVVIIDTLDNNLWIPSFEVLSSSHAYTCNISGPGVITFRFDNILLADSNVNEKLSHGFIKYRVRVKNTLAIGDAILNTAYIYFDFNESVITNTTINVVGFTGFANPSNSNAANVTVIPNPNNGEFSLLLNYPSSDDVLIELFDLFGNRIYNTTTTVLSNEAIAKMKIQGFANGVYLLKLTSNNAVITRKIIKQ